MLKVKLKVTQLDLFMFQLALMDMFVNNKEAAVEEVVEYKLEMMAKDPLDGSLRMLELLNKVSQFEIPKDYIYNNKKELQPKEMRNLLLEMLNN